MNQFKLIMIAFTDQNSMFFISIYIIIFDFSNFHFNIKQQFMQSVESISVKVTYKAKNVIIGKGIETEQQIIAELEKRFPEITGIKSSLVAEYEDGATTLKQAYQLALSNHKKNIKVKIIEDRSVDKTTVILLPKFQQSSEDPLSLSFDQKNKNNASDLLEQQAKPFRRRSSIKDEKQQLQEKKQQDQQQKILKEQQPQQKSSHIPNSQSNKQLQQLLLLTSDKVNDNKQKLIEKQQFLSNTQKQSQKQQKQPQKHTVKEQIQQFEANNQRGQFFQDKNQEKRQLQSEKNQQKKSTSVRSSSKSSLLGASHSSIKSTDKLPCQKKADQERIMNVDDKPYGSAQPHPQANTQNVEGKDLNKKINYVSIGDGKKSRKDSAKQYSKSSSSISLQKIDEDDSFHPVNKQENRREELKLQNQVDNMHKSFQDQIDQMKVQFATKIQQLQHKNNYLAAQYQDLAQKYEKMSQAIEKGSLSSNNQKDNLDRDAFNKDGYKKLPQEDNLKQLGTFSKQFKAEIIQMSKIESINVGEVVAPRFHFKNIGENKWPSNVHAIEKNSMEQIQIESLQPDEQLYRVLGQEKGTKIGEQIKKTYQLCAYNKKGEMIIFGPDFGYTINVVRLNQKLEKQIEAFIKNKKLKPKSKIDQIISKFEEIGINEKNFKDCDEDILLAIIGNS